MAEREFFSSEDAEIDDFLDQELGGEDGSTRDDSEDFADDDEDGAAPSEESDEDDEDDGPEAEDDGDDEDEEGDENGEPEGDEDDGEPVDPLAEERAKIQANAEAALKIVQDQLAERVKAVQQQETHVKTAQKLIDLKASMPAEEWDKFTSQLTQAYAVQQLKQQREAQTTDLDKAKKVIATFVARDEMIERQAEQTAMREVVITNAVQKYLGGKVTVAEAQALENTPPERFMTVLQALVDARQDQTAPARQALRERRQLKNADRAPLRATGGAKGVAKNYDNYDPDAGLDAYLDEQFEGTALAEPKKKRRRAA